MGTPRTSTIMLLLFLLLLSSTEALSAPSKLLEGEPNVTLSYGTFQGFSLLGTDRFLGIPFAQAERFGLPQPPSNVPGVQDASEFGPACPQQSLFPSGLHDPEPGTSKPSSALTTSEDCLFVNVIRPSNIPTDRKLPVLFWIYGGGFQFGDTSQYDGSTVVARSIALGEPVIYVSANYRVSAWGFLASEEVRSAEVGNLGLRDQRFALQWVQENIALFGGDPSKVTIWGQSSGAISVGLHMVINGGDTEGLFRGAVMESGSPPPLGDIGAGQPFYDQLVEDTNCASSTDTFACLKATPIGTLQDAVDKSPGVLSFTSLQLAWQPRVDGIVITENPQDSIENGAYAQIPMITGNCDDEGTRFSFPQFNLTTDQEGVNYLHENYIPEASDEEFRLVADLYPSDPAQGSPFDTGDMNQLYPQFKRIAAVQGDLVFQAPRRFFLNSAARTQDTWAFLYKRGKDTPIIGSAHGDDIKEFYASESDADFQGTDALVNFCNNLDPNMGVSTGRNISTLIAWPKYSTNASDPPLLTFLDPKDLTISPDTYRAAGMEVLTDLSRLFA